VRRLPSAPLSASAARSPSVIFAGVELEIPFDKVAMQMGFANGMMGTKHRAFHQAETTFCGVDVHEAAKPHILIGGMVDSAVAGKLATKLRIARKFIGHQIRVAVHNAHDGLPQGLGRYVRNVERVAWPSRSTSASTVCFFGSFFAYARFFILPPITLSSDSTTLF
jgi:hypothetical protein